MLFRGKMSDQFIIFIFIDTFLCLDLFINYLYQIGILEKHITVLTNLYY